MGDDQYENFKEDVIPPYCIYAYDQDAAYLVPPTDVREGDPADALFILADDIVRIGSRMKQLLGKSAWAENPPSRTRRMISNVRVIENDGENEENILSGNARRLLAHGQHAH